jgi:hypothetical protein
MPLHLFSCRNQSNYCISINSDGVRVVYTVQYFTFENGWKKESGSENENRQGEDIFDFFCTFLTSNFTVSMHTV